MPKDKKHHPNKKHSDEKLARVLAEWSLSSFATFRAKDLVKTHGISDSTLWRAKKRLINDSGLQEKFNNAVNIMLDGEWSQGIDRTMSDLLNRIKVIVSEEKDLDKLTNAFSTIGDYSLAKQVLEDE